MMTATLIAMFSRSLVYHGAVPRFHHDGAATAAAERRRRNAWPD